MLTGIKDTDRLILEKIEDEEDFLKFRTVNKYFYGLYDEEVFRKRIIKNYPESIFRKQNNLLYKDFYLQLLYYKDLLKSEFNFTSGFTSGDPISYYLLMKERMFRFWKIRKAIELGYTDLVIFLSEKEKPINRRMLTGLFLLSSRVGNKYLIDYYLSMGDFGEYEYKKAIGQAELSGHFEIVKYLNSLF